VRSPVLVTDVWRSVNATRTGPRPKMTVNACGISPMNCSGRQGAPTGDANRGRPHPTQNEDPSGDWASQTGQARGTAG
jgi:hypothetical protein